ncbi:tetratricopeptide repeat protein [Pelagicoccus mobilis]|uniref:Tetratricopeptide repeat protein n=1 Tax=Pelagicoccus mobilis TaxID=415221 RepID=A0A934S422_9BACT|nr:hypothetical protein [Pelagicoccus mobilis]MBK1878658.1 hypothetical protein [Pelagicoccus mobilis]
MKMLPKSVAVAVATLVLPFFSFAGEMEELRSAVEKSDWGSGKSIGEALTATETENGEAFYLLGKSLVGLKENEAAVVALKRANELVSGNADYLADYGYALIMRGQEMNMFQAGPTFLRAMDQYKAAVEVNPDHMGAHIGLARYYMNAPAIGGGSMVKAKEHAAEVARINPFRGHIESAEIAKKENRFADVEAEYAAAIALDPKQGWVHFELAKQQQASGKMMEAKASYEKALELNPEHQGAKKALEAFGG